MGRLKTTEELAEMFARHKAERQQLIQKKRIKKRKEYNKKYRELSKAVNEALRDEKKKKMEQLTSLVTKPSQKALKQPQIKSYIYHSHLIERDAREDDLYTLEELKNIEELYPEETGRINWSAWDRIINKCREEL